VLNECIADPCFVGSAEGNQACRAANEWLKSNATLSADSFYQQVQAAALKYTKIEKFLDEADRWVGEHDL